MTISKHFRLVKAMGILLGLAIAAFAGRAKADGIVIGPGAIRADARVKLETEIAAARAKAPAVFKAVRAVNTHLPAGTKNLRKNEPTTAREFRRLGKPALYALIELTAFDGANASLTTEQRRALGSGLLQALAFFRDPNAMPVLEAVFLQAKDSAFVEHAAEGLGMVCGSSELSLLLASSVAGSSRRAAAVVGLGYCRTKQSAERLADILAERPASPLAEKVVRALGLVGSSWAIAADRKLAKQDADAIQRTAARALVLAYPDYQGRLRLNVHRAALMVEHPAVSEWIAHVAPTAPADVQRGLAQLELRLRKNRARAANP